MGSGPVTTGTTRVLSGPIRPPSSPPGIAPVAQHAPVRDDQEPTTPPDVGFVLTLLEKTLDHVVVGTEWVVRSLAISLVAGGHVLLEGLPGLAKTLIVRSFAETMSLSFKRIQFTPDMLPSDIIGGMIFSPKKQEFEFRPGPIFGNIILADEINRAPPKVQSALLEAMQEQQVTVEGHPYALPRPFMVIATQNPVEQEGTYPLPEAELDRFLFRLLLDYPNRDDELRLMRLLAEKPSKPKLAPLFQATEILRLMKLRETVFVSDELVSHVTDLVRETRKDASLLMGVSPRAGVQFVQACKSLALLVGRDYVLPEDVRSLTFQVFNHRLVPRPEVVAEEIAAGRYGTGIALRRIVNDVVKRVPVPR